ncbi:MAG: hypothetical protein JW891_04295 [Candidatus Lokiarchaeota archaeon]|nr:hypothetical protein [Candidatus Lokiarchaeota archaeon]
MMEVNEKSIEEKLEESLNDFQELVDFCELEINRFLGENSQKKCKFFRILAGASYLFMLLVMIASYYIFDLPSELYLIIVPYYVPIFTIVFVSLYVLTYYAIEVKKRFVFGKVIYRKLVKKLVLLEKRFGLVLFNKFLENDSKLDHYEEKKGKLSFRISTLSSILNKKYDFNRYEVLLSIVSIVISIVLVVPLQGIDPTPLFTFSLLIFLYVESIVLFVINRFNAYRSFEKKTSIVNEMFPKLGAQVDDISNDLFKLRYPTQDEEKK